jgi:hypothetical protein
MGRVVRCDVSEAAHALCVRKEKDDKVGKILFPRRGTGQNGGKVELGQEEKKRAGPKERGEVGRAGGRNREGERPREKKRRGVFIFFFCFFFIQTF